MSDLRDIGTTSHSFQSPEKEKRKENTWEKTFKTCFLKNNLCWNYFAEMYLMKYLFGLKLINTSERVAYYTKMRENGADSCNNKQIKGSSRWNTNSHTFVRGEKQAFRNLPIFELTLCLFRAGKQRSRNKATHLETSFPKNLTKNMFSFHLKNCFCCHDKHKLLNSNRFQFVFCA